MMKRPLLAVMAMLLATPLAHSDIDETRATMRERVVRLINRDRQLYNLPPVQLDLETSAIGDAYCEQQIANRTTGHFTVDGLPPYMRYSLAGGNDGVSENAAAWSANYAFNDRALSEMIGRSQDAMMAEPPGADGHKKTILDPHATHVGVGLAWEKGEFRLVQEFIRRYVDWSRPLPRAARIGDEVTAAGKARPGARIEAITVHHEPVPETMPAHVASALESYSLPDKRKEYLPRLKNEYTKSADGTLLVVRREYENGHRGDFHAGADGAFSFNVPFTEGPGIYTVVVWVSRDAARQPIAASNVSIRVEPFAGAPVTPRATR